MLYITNIKLIITLNMCILIMTTVLSKPVDFKYNLNQYASLSSTEILFYTAVGTLILLLLLSEINVNWVIYCFAFKFC